jgi:predicted MFS family arabinose efflux permease
MPLALLVITTVLAHTAFNGTRLSISLDALSLGASPFTVGVLMSLIAALPMFFGVWSGRLVDRIGVRKPMIGGISAVIVFAALPAVFPGLEALYFAATGIGSGFALFHICVQHMVGEMSSPVKRRENFGWLALGFATSNFLGPTISGTSIDYFGHRATFCILAGFACAALAIVFSRRAALRHKHHHERDVTERSAFELLRNPELRRVFVVTGLLASAWDLYTFVMPIYGTSIGLNATTIGLILGSFASATFVVRMMLPWLQHHIHEWPLITLAFFVACIAYGLFPIARTVPPLVAISFLLGLALGATQPSIMALVYSTAPEGRSGEAVGVRTVVLNASSTFFPLVFGGVSAALGMMPVFAGMSVALAAGGWFANRRRLAHP